MSGSAMVFGVSSVSGDESLRSRSASGRNATSTLPFDVR
jgi:hypothetical protein